MTGDYEVGYKRPPAASQWRKGQSGNPKGRSKGTRNLATDLAEELSEAVQVKEHGKSRKISKQRALIKSLLAKAVQGDMRAAALLMTSIVRLLPPESTPPDADSISQEDEAILDMVMKLRRGGAGEGHTG